MAPSGGIDATRRFMPLSRMPWWPDDGTSICWPWSDGETNPVTQRSMWRAVLLITVLAVAGCHSRRPDFMARVKEDCLVGQQWACDLIASLNTPPPLADSGTPKNISARPQ
jgi:hypothetical protein